jgi:hypothetical protein
MNLLELLQMLRDTGDYSRLTLDIMAQFGTETAPYLGAQLLPEQLRSENAYTEQQVRYMSVLANAGSSYSPAQVNTGGRIFGEFKVSFGNTNVADNLTAGEYASLMKLIALSTAGGNDNATLQAAAQVMRFLDRSIREPMLMLNELYRWQAIIDGVVKRRGSNGYAEDVIYPMPAGHRVTIPGGTVANPAGWFENDNSYDPYNDFLAAKRFLAAKGYTISRIFSNFSAAHAFMGNSRVRDRLAGSTVLGEAATFQRMAGSVSLEKVNAELQAMQIAQWEIYDRTFNYRNPSSTNANGIETGRFLDRMAGAIKVHPVVLVCSSGRSEDMIDFGDRSSLPNGGITLDDTLGYYGIGTVAGQAAPGRHFYETVTEKHPGGLYAESIQEGLPVITEPEAIYVMMVQEPA